MPWSKFKSRSLFQQGELPFIFTFTTNDLLCKSPDFLHLLSSAFNSLHVYGEPVKRVKQNKTWSLPWGHLRSGWIGKELLFPAVPDLDPAPGLLKGILQQ